MAEMAGESVAVQAEDQPDYFDVRLEEREH